MADDRDQAQERTERATPRRLQQAKEKGQLVRSRELTTTIMLLSVATWIYLAGPQAIASLARLMRGAFTVGPPAIGSEASMMLLLQGALIEALILLAPVLGVSAAVALLGAVALGGWSFSAQALAFKWEKLDPVKGLGRVFSWNGLMELLKALIKFTLVVSAALGVLWLWSPSFLAIGHQALPPALAGAGLLVIGAFFTLCLATVPVAVVDVPFQLWSHARKLRMTRQEVKEEFKETEGKPEVKAKVRALQREIAQRRMMEAVPRADVVVTNPAHFAVALAYDPHRMRAPVLLAKGADRVAARIREVAAGAGVPVVRAPRLARAVYYNTRIDQEIPVALYLAVAQVLAYVYQLDAGGAAEAFPGDLPVPEDLLRPRAAERAR